MSSGQFLVRNRHNNIWYGRIIIPHQLRSQFLGKHEFRKSLGTSNRIQAKRQALEFWVHCQHGFDRLRNNRSIQTSFRSTAEFLSWLSLELTERRTLVTMGDTRKPGHPEVVEAETPFGVHRIDFGDPEKEAELALKLQEHYAALLDKYKDNPEILDRLLKAQSQQASSENSSPIPVNSAPLPETPTPFKEAIDLYINKLKSRAKSPPKKNNRPFMP